MRQISLIAVLLTVFFWLCINSLAQAEKIFSLDGSFIQGGLVIGKTDPKNYVEINGQSLNVTGSGHFVLGIGYKETNISILVTSPSGLREKKEILITKRNYDTQRIDGLPTNKVSPPGQVIEKINHERSLVYSARQRNSSYTDFLDQFIWPVTGVITGVYGSKRILNGNPRQPHFGLDIAGPIGRPICSPAGGVVSLAESNMFFSGGTVIIDHGHGLSSTFLHLSQIKVNIGERVEKGSIIGAMGDTGRVTGAHLDWRISWFQKRLDPALLVGPMPKILISPSPMRP